MTLHLKPWGLLAVVNLYDCDRSLITSPEHIKPFGIKLCEVIGMQPYGEPDLNRFGTGDLEGYSLLQKIATSSITVHLDEVDNRAFIDIFSCKSFDPQQAAAFSQEYFGAKGRTVDVHERR